MKIGITEMLIVGVVIMLIIGASRFFPMRSRAPVQEKPARQLTAVEARDEAILRSRRGKGKIVGIVLVVVGILLIVSAPQLIKYFFMSYIGGALIIVIGLASLFFMSRRS